MWVNYLRSAGALAMVDVTPLPDVPLPDVPRAGRSGKEVPIAVIVSRRG
jgi:hypothetical protein